MKMEVVAVVENAAVVTKMHHGDGEGSNDHQGASASPLWIM